LTLLDYLNQLFHWCFHFSLVLKVSNLRPILFVCAYFYMLKV
jgi:hypothetical protein